ncbi:Fasciclin domain [Sphingobacterium spiritivorum]|uniref:Fasciclin domain n=1 Tax=Sphingobacterium spiritivorum TaxID=258 RepID=A0A380BA70_SPHSI|nr:fasciclin domain-containing protein [Sphingobacterium spiritivorum]SUI96688.1 Fasciclin domain [Sphingobacterium spiritivorum]
MKRLIFALLAAVICFSSCKKAWESHYGTTDGTTTVSPLNLLDYLKSKPEYSKFVAKLEETGLVQELQRDQYLTVWAVSNEQMDRLAQLNLDEKYVMGYHINNLTYDVSKLKKGLRLKTLNGKYLSINQDASGKYQIGDAAIVNGNQLCKNGVVHEINGLMKPDVSIYEYLEGLGSDYSIIRDTILRLNDTIFDLANSVPIGVDPTGNTVYDSAYVIKNPIFEKANIRSEFVQVSMFLPSNQVLNNCFNDLRSLYAQFGKTFEEDDYLKAMSWIKEAIFYNTLVDNYGSEENIYSAFNKLWKTSVQQVNPVYKRMSNGRIFEISKLKVPNNVHIDMIKQFFHYWEYVPDNEKGNLFTVLNATSVVPTDRDNASFPTLGLEYKYRTLVLKGAKIAGAPLSIDFTPVLTVRNSDGSTGYKVVEVPPGEYNLYMGFRSSTHPFVNIYIDGKLIKSALNVEPSTPWNYDRSTNTVGSTKYNGWGGLVGPVIIDGNQVRRFKIKVEFAGLGKGTVEQIELYHWALIPTQNNY